MTTHLYTEFLPLLQHRLVPIRATPLLNLLDATNQSSPANVEGHCLALYCPVATFGLAPIVRETKQVKRFSSLAIFPTVVRLFFTTAFKIVGRPEISQFCLFG